MALPLATRSGKILPMKPLVFKTNRDTDTTGYTTTSYLFYNPTVDLWWLCSAHRDLCVFHARCYGRQKGSVLSRDLGKTNHVIFFLQQTITTKYFDLMGYAHLYFQLKYAKYTYERDLIAYNSCKMRFGQFWFWLMMWRMFEIMTSIG